GPGLVRVDLETGEVDTSVPVPIGGLMEAQTAPLEATVRADKREPTAAWYEYSPTHWRYELHFGAALAEDDCDPCDPRLVEVRFARTGESLAYCPGLIEDEVRTYALGDFVFQNGEVYLPLPNGLIGLGGDLWIIKHTREQHIAARVAPDEMSVAFIDATPQVLTEDVWVFDLVEGSAEDALAIANRINLHPEVFFD
ncbi:MAG: hypothetical protein QF464_13605, partial [Myxococcota bacterium]|nr:hypothetical protein [Myxococcota bacterium]